MATKFNFLYLDDNEKNTRDGDVEYLNAFSSKIEIKTDYPGSWAQRAKQILAELPSIDGLILDWELTNKSEQAKLGTNQAEDVDFSAESLAEHLRISVIKNGTRDIPIILCSADKNKAFTQLRDKELTSNDLFDLTFIKMDLFNTGVEKAELELFDLAQAYNWLQNNELSALNILNLSEKELEKLDIRFMDSLDIISKTKTVHDLVYFLLNNLM
ncbi:MAG: hypothetical protein Q8K64_10930 [Sediminibacterium sp.]|nr:hypothetical protein [Sediminibacterium sp.]